MTTEKLLFTADDQKLTVSKGLKLTEGLVNYVEAQFTLNGDWNEVDQVKAVWNNGFHTVSVLTAHGKCVVPQEMLSQISTVKVNLVGSCFEGFESEALIYRLVTEQIPCILVTKPALIDGDNAQITPTEFEQFVAAVHSDAQKAQEAASQLDNFDFYMDDDGYIWFSYGQEVNNG